jgi:hypothetical protein
VGNQIDFQVAGLIERLPLADHYRDLPPEQRAGLGLRHPASDQTAAERDEGALDGGDTGTQQEAFHPGLLRQVTMALQQGEQLRQEWLQPLRADVGPRPPSRP